MKVQNPPAITIGPGVIFAFKGEINVNEEDHLLSFRWRFKLDQPLEEYAPSCVYTEVCWQETRACLHHALGVPPLHVQAHAALAAEGLVVQIEKEREHLPVLIDRIKALKEFPDVFKQAIAEYIIESITPDVTDLLAS